MLGLDLYEDGICACGFHESLTQDKSNHFTFEDKTCGVCGGASQWSRIQADKDEQALKAMGENVPPAVKRPSDGRRTFIRPMSDLEVEQRLARQDERRRRS